MFTSKLSSLTICFVIYLLAFYFSFILIKPIIEIILNKIIGKNTDKYIGILFVNPKTLKILFI